MFKWFINEINIYCEFNSEPWHLIITLSRKTDDRNMSLNIKKHRLVSFVLRMFNERISKITLRYRLQLGGQRGWRKTTWQRAVITVEWVKFLTKWNIGQSTRQGFKLKGYNNVLLL